MRAVIYTRVSSEEQVENYSLSAQEDAASKFAQERGWNIVEERGRSAKDTNRPQFQQMTRDADNKLFDVILVHKLDRFSRNVTDMLSSIKMLDESGITLASVTEQGFDYSTPQGRLLLSMLAMFAQWYLDNLSAETSKGKRERARKGSWNGTLPFGYTNLRRLKEEMASLREAIQSGETSNAKEEHLQLLSETYEDWHALTGETDAIPCPINASGVQLAFEMYAQGGYSDRDVANVLNQAGYRTSGNWGENPFGKDTVTPMLKNRFYLGETSYKGGKRGAERKWQEGNHEAIISEDLFETCQKVRKKRAGGRGTSGSKNHRNVYPLASLVVCLYCGSNLRGWALRNDRRYKDPAEDRSVDCSADVKSIKAEVIEEQVEEIVLSLNFPEDWRERAINMLKERHQKPTYEKSQQKTLQDRLARLKDLYEMGDIDRNEYLERRDNIQQELNTLPLPVQSTVVDLELATELLEDTQRLWKAATLSERKMWLERLFEQLYEKDRRIVGFKPTPIMSILLEINGNTDVFYTSSNYYRVVKPDASWEEIQATFKISVPS
ncbi:MAG: recombinase family protein [Aggregatilineales bacterium]